LRRGVETAEGEERGERESARGAVAEVIARAKAWEGGGGGGWW
jgi:hypothetical protein